jgi:hypothetical protein
MTEHHPKTRTAAGPFAALGLARDTASSGSETRSIQPALGFQPAHGSKEATAAPGEPSGAADEPTETEASGKVGEASRTEAGVATGSAPHAPADKLGEESGEPPSAVDLYRFQAIPVSDEMREELLLTRMPLASAEQLADTHPPNRGLKPPGKQHFASIRHERSVPTELDLTPGARTPPFDPRVKLDPPEEAARGIGAGDPEASAQDNYRAQTPTLPSVRRQRMRQRRLVGGLALCVLSLLFGALVLGWEAPASDAEALGSSVASPARHISGNQAAPHSDLGSVSSRTAVSKESAGPSFDRGGDSSPNPGKLDKLDKLVTVPGKPGTTPTDASQAPGSPAPASRSPAPASAPGSPAPAPRTPAPRTPAPRPQPPPQKQTFNPEELIF